MDGMSGTELSHFTQRVPATQHGALPRRTDVFICRGSALLVSLWPPGGLVVWTTLVA